jgi:methylglyoxal synthase
MGEGGEQQIASRIAYNEIDCLLYFRDSSNDINYEKDSTDILRLCDVHNIPAATNIAMAEILICAVDRGDLDWRNYVNPIYNKTREN